MEGGKLTMIQPSRSVQEKGTGEELDFLNKLGGEK